MERRNFIKNCIYGCMFPYLLSGCKINVISRDNDIQTHKSLDFQKIPHINHVEIHLVEHCNLNCKYCSHFSSIAEEKFYQVNKYKKDLKRLSQVTNKQIKSIQLLGGEPLLHPKINEFFRITRTLFPYSSIDVITNGILLDSMQESFWESLSKYRISLLPTIYPIKINWESIINKAQKYNCRLKVFNGEPGKNATLKTIERAKVKNFYKVTLDLEGKQEMNIKCRHLSSFSNFIDGKLYPCFVAANIKHFNKKFNKNIPITNKDYLDICKTKDLEEIIAFLEQPVPFCKYCNISSYRNVAWSCNSLRDISEWI